MGLFLPFGPSSLRVSVLACWRYVFLRRQANYHDHVEVDYLDYDEVHYFRFRRGEKQLARPSFKPTARSESGGGLLRFKSRQRRSSGNQERRP